MTQDGLTRQLALFIANSANFRVDADVARVVKNGFIDTAATTLAGRDEPVVHALLRFLEARSSSGWQTAESRLLYGPRWTSARDAALVNATAGHALDYDDVGLCGHPSTVLVPVLLAEGERLHASGEALIRAYVVGYETWAELLFRDADLHHAKGWHPTAVFGVVACAAAVSALRGVDVDI
ncbi:MAG: MmgE/PrpD family protein, partial [Rhizobacter sp.]|nr:MmgE/PrpD family protein [Rhizobacter sp.]